MFDFLYDMDRRQMTRVILLGIILFTLPCYCLGAIFLAYAPKDDPKTQSAPTNPTLGGATALPTQMLTHTFTPFFSSTPLQGGLTSTPGQFFVPPSATSFVWPTFTLTLTPTPFPTGIPTLTKAPTLTPTLTLVPSATLLPTDTPTETLIPPDTPTPTPTFTVTPTPTATDIPTGVPTEVPTIVIQPTLEPPPTQEVLD